MKDDLQLIDESLAGQTASFGELVTRHQDRLFNTLVHVLSSTEDARDVAQDAFVQAFVKLETFQRNSAFYTWLYRIAVNMAISRRRRRRPTVSVDQMSDQTGSEPVDSGGQPSDRLEEQERAKRLHDGLAKLAEEHRTVLVLREMEGHNYEDIAEMLAIPIGTVRSRLHRARMQLREQLKEMLQEDRS